MQIQAFSIHTGVPVKIKNLHNDVPKPASLQRCNGADSDGFRRTSGQPRFGMRPEVLRYTTLYNPQASADLQALIRNPAEFLSVQDRDWVLVRAIRHEDVEMIKTLHETGTDFNAKSTNLEHETNISFAIKQDKSKSVAALLAGGTRVDLPEANGKLPIQAALLRGVKPEILGTLLDYGARLSVLTDTERQKLSQARENNPAVQKLLEKQLCKAAAKGDCDDLLVLLGIGVNPKAVCNGWNAASLAAKHGHDSALRLLEARGCVNFFPELVIRFATDMLAAEQQAALLSETDVAPGNSGADEGAPAVPLSPRQVLLDFLMAKPFSLMPSSGQAESMV
jgi:hypothetical protein